LHTLRRTFFWIYFWQKRGERFNRFFNGLSENKTILIPKSSIFALGALFLFPVLKKIAFPFEIIVFSIYLLLGIYSLYFLFVSLAHREFREYFFIIPKFTKKTIVLSLLISVIEGGLFTVLFLKGIYYLAFGVLLFEIFFPLFFLLCAFTVKILSFPYNLFLINQSAKKIKKRKNLIVIGISGSYGKSLMKEFLYQLLSVKYKVLKTEGRQSSLMEIIKTINKKLKNNHQVFICEISAYRKGEVSRICKLLNPKMGILTGISEDHLSLFGSLKKIISTKNELINNLPEDGLAIFNIEDKECQRLFQRSVISKSCYSGCSQNSEVFAKDVNKSQKGISFTIVTPKGEKQIELNFPSTQNIESFTGAVLCSLKLGLNLSDVVATAEKIQLPEGILTIQKGPKKSIVIDDTLSQTPNGFYGAVDHLKKNFVDQQKIIIASCLPELGKAANSIHNNIGKKIGEICELAIITTPFFFKEIKLGAVSEGMSKKKIIFLRDPKTILKAIQPYLSKKSVVLFEGDVSDKIKEKIIDSK
jgi:UDP-N-acetylmuramoyl-tripeptide--D-alanyl-D-alanine ligase